MKKRENMGVYTIWKDEKYLDEFLESEAFKNSVEKYGQPEVNILDIVVLIEEGKMVSS